MARWIDADGTIHTGLALELVGDEIFLGSWCIAKLHPWVTGSLQDHVRELLERTTTLQPLPKESQ